MRDIYTHYGKALLGVAMSLVNDEDRALDVLQESLVNIWKNGSSYDSSKGRLYTWMLNIVRNKAIDSIRSSDRREKIQTPVEDVSVHESGYEFNTDTIGLHSQLAKLDPEKRKLIELSYIQGYSHSEIAEQLALPLGTVKTRIRSAILELKQIFI
ncbi:MAG: sigma-70 family RNA polymerase sigma factor [Bacteroidetes bacterium]|nr:sigma-70 family RNA polymerase sigma factor [Bacteroidota bacterium]